jgi:hypothetical protein
MPYSATWEPHGLCLKFCGTVDPAEIARLYDETLRDRRFDDLRYVVGDFVDATGHGFTVGDMQSMRELNASLIGASFSNPYVVIAIATTDPGLREVAHDFARLGLYVVELFETAAAARDWAVSRNPTGTFQRLDPH